MLTVQGWITRIGVPRPHAGLIGTSVDGDYIFSWRDLVGDLVFGDQAEGRRVTFCVAPKNPLRARLVRPTN